MSKKKPVSEKAPDSSESAIPSAADTVATSAADTTASATEPTVAVAPADTAETPKPEASEPVSKIVPTAGSYPFVPKPAPVDGLTPHVCAVAEMGLGDVNPFD